MSSNPQAMNLPLREAWRRRVESSGGRPFLWTEGVELDFRAAHEEVSRIAQGLHDAGVGVGNIVAVGMTNRVEDVLLHLALQWIGAVTMPLLTTATFEELAYQLNHSQCRLVFADAALRETLRPRINELVHIEHVIASDSPQLPGEPTLATLRASSPMPHPELPAYDDSSPFALLYTSGSSGRPKGVLLPAGAPSSVARGIVDRIGVDDRDTLFVPTPLAHAVGLVTMLGTAVHCGCRLAIVDRFRPSRFWAQIDSSGGSVCCLFPAHCNLLLTADSATRESSLRAVFTHTFNAEFVRRFNVDLHMCWGMTETGALMTMSGALRGDVTPGYIGEAMPDTEVACFDTSNRRLPAGETGELRLLHRHVMIGYYRDPAATDLVMHDGWIGSGDLGRIDAQGHAFFDGRAKNVIKRSGETISAEEVESVLLALDPVRECLVFGTPDAMRSEEVVACLYLDPDRAFQPEALLAAAAERLSKFKLPRFLVSNSTPLPKLDNGKFDRRSILSSFDRSRAWDRDAHQSKSGSVV
jgi:crotonobetaine/carnitine-CoA ligase